MTSVKPSIINIRSGMSNCGHSLCRVIRGCL
jgi:hypothetical protein